MSRVLRYLLLVGALLLALGIPTSGQAATASLSGPPVSSTLSSPPASATATTRPSSSSSPARSKRDDPLVLTTVFTQPAGCATGITEIAAWSTELWQNVVSPAPGLTLSSCYPSPFYRSALATSVLPPFRELVCPLRWEPYQINATYLICCPSGYGLYAPEFHNTERPGLGAVCTSTVGPSVLMDITSYDATGLVTTLATRAGDDGTLVFATAFDGTAARSVATATPNSQSSSPASVATTSAAVSSSVPSSARSSPSTRSSATTLSLTAWAFPVWDIRVSLAVLVSVFLGLANVLR
ncbi:hypothetical protein VTK73DRAFT_820 [Phialemonium thermophilum]|uniref:Uncharacterized protein n=1 Tax=Phialemonium thermophilum TaxID=223376 RepID=A0ABR3VUF1_9PEZI